MKKNILFFYFALPALLILVSCKKDKKDSFSEVSGKWLFKSITVQDFNAQGTMVKEKVFNKAYEDNDLTIENSGMYEVRELPTFMYNATYCFKGENAKNNHKGIWEFDAKKKQMWFDRGITEYFNSTSGLIFSQKYSYTVENNQLVLENVDPKAVADFGYNIGRYYFSGLWYDPAADDNTQGNSDGYRNGYWRGYYDGSPSGEQLLLDKDAFYSYWSIGVANNEADTSNTWQYPNYKSGYETGYNNGYNDGVNAASAVDWNANKTYKMTIVYTKL